MIPLFIGAYATAFFSVRVMVHSTVCTVVTRSQVSVTCADGSRPIIQRDSDGVTHVVF